MNPQHSDLLLLRKLLLEEAVEEISRSKVTRCGLSRSAGPPAGCSPGHAVPTRPRAR